MKASELMIGDWVYILNFPERGKKTPVKIIGMDTNHSAVEYVHNGIRLWSAVVLSLSFSLKKSSKRMGLTNMAKTLYMKKMGFICK